jgi:two-component system, LytTR family, sensor histidine kinase AlgZ
MPATAAAVSRPPVRTLLLPDFCAARAVLAVVMIVELVALIFAMARHSIQQDFWIDFAGCSVFLLWLGLVCTAVLCRARHWLERMSVARAASVAMALMLSAVSVIAELIYQLGQAVSGGMPLSSSPFPADHGGFMLRTLAVSFIVSALTLRYFYVSAEWKRSIEMEALARLRALQARIRPHFLFNSMNTIAALTRSSPERAEQAVEDLADLFRASLNEAHTQIQLRDEVDIARTHQRIEQLRLGNRLCVEWDIEALPLRAEVPSLIIQPLLENAVYHGIEMLPAGGTVRISGKLQGQQIQIEVRNPIAPAGHGEREGNRMALENIRQRLDLAWPGRTHVEARVEGAEFCARLVFPYAEAPSHERA